MTLITRQDAAQRLCISLRTLDELIHRGALRAYRIGPKIIRISAEDLDAFVAGRLVAPAAKKAEPAARPCRYVRGMKVV